MKKIEEKKANKDEQFGEKVQKKINRAKSADNQEELEVGRKPKNSINREQLIEENKAILEPLTEEEMEIEKHKTYLQKIQRKHYKLKTEKELNRGRDTKQQQPLKFQAKTCNKQFYSLLKRMKSKDLNMVSVHILYGYMMEKHPNEITQEEKDWYAAKRPHLRKYVQKEKDLRAKRATRGSKQLNEVIEVNPKKRQRLSNSNKEQKKVLSPLVEIEKQLDLEEQMESQDAFEENDIGGNMLMSLDLSEHPQDENPDENISNIQEPQPKTFNQILYELPLNDSETITEMQCDDSKATILEATKSGHISSQIAKQSLVQNPVEELNPPVEVTREKKMKLPIQQKERIRSNKEADQSVEIIECQPSQMMQVNPQKSVNPSQSKLVRESRQIITRGETRSLQESINSLNPKTSSKSTSRQRTYGPKTQPIQNLSIKQSTFVQPPKTLSKTFTDTSQKPPLEILQPLFIEDGELQDIGKDIVEIYRQTEILYSQEQLSHLGKGDGDPSKEEQKNSISPIRCLPIKKLSQQNNDFLAPEQWNKIIKFLQKLDTNFRVFEESETLKNFYNLDKESIFLEISSGCGVSCLHVQLITNCLSYGIDENFDSIVDSTWLRAHLECKLSKPKAFYLFNKTQFINGKFKDLTHFGIGDFIQHPATHILMTNTNQVTETCDHILRILKNSAFRVLIWPFNEDSTLDLLCNDGIIKPTELQLVGVTTFKQYFANSQQADTQLYIYIRLFTPELLATLYSKPLITEMIKHETQRISTHMDQIKNNQPMVSMLQLSQSAKKWIYWKQVKVSEIQKKLLPTAVDPLVPLANQVAKTSQSTDFQIHQQPLQMKSKEQENTEYQTYLQIIKEFDQGIIEKSYKIIRLLYSGPRSLVIQVKSDISDYWVQKVSTKAKGSFEALQKELAMAKQMCSMSTSNRILRHRNDFQYESNLNKKQRQKGVANLRQIIVYDFFPFNLYDLMQKRFFKDINAIQFIFAGIALGVREFHKNSLAHCDLKPTNIMIDKNMRPVIGDYGSTSQALTNRFVLTNTPPYMPEEYFTQQILVQSGYDYRKADIWSLGVILFEMIYGHKPFKMINSKGSQKVKLQLTTEEVTQVFKRNFISEDDVPDIILDPSNPNKLKDAILLIKAMLKNINDRVNIHFVLGHPFISDLVLKYEKKNLQSEAKQGFNEFYMQYLNKFGAKVKESTEKKQREKSTTPVRTPNKKKE